MATHAAIVATICLAGVLTRVNGARPVLTTARIAEPAPGGHANNVVWACSSLNRGVALTFDDGPSAGTAQLLDNLKALGVKATFFVCGGAVMALPDVVRRAAEEGHEIGIHTFSHCNLTRLYESCQESGDWEAWDHEIEDTARLITNITGKAPRLVRPPYGAAHGGVARKLAEQGYTVVMWSGGCIDWWLNDMQASLPYLINGMADAGSLLCLHDSYPSTCANITQLVNLLSISTPQTTVNPQGRPMLSMSECLAMPPGF